MNLAAGLSFAADVRAQDLSRAPAATRPSLEHAPSTGAAAGTSESSAQRNSRRFEDALDDSLSGVRSGGDDERPVVSDRRHRAQRDQRDQRVKHKAAERRASLSGNDDDSASETTGEKSCRRRNRDAAVEVEASSPEQQSVEHSEQQTSEAASNEATSLPQDEPEEDVEVQEAGTQPTAGDTGSVAIAVSDASAGGVKSTAPSQTGGASSPITRGQGQPAAPGAEAATDVPDASSEQQQGFTAPGGAFLQTVVDVGDAPVGSDLDDVAQSQAVEAQAPGGAAAIAAAETAFAGTSDEDAREPSGEASTIRQQGLAVERQVGQSFTPPATASDDTAVDTAHAARISGAGLATTPVPRFQEFETAQTRLATAGYAEVPDADTPDRIVQSLRVQFQRGGGDAIVHIKPEHLGPLTISLRVEHGAVMAHVTADNPVTAEWLQAHEQTLRDGLRSNGLQLDRLVINRDRDPSDRSPHREESQPQREQRRRFNDRRSTFEITV